MVYRYLPLYGTNLGSHILREMIQFVFNICFKLVETAAGDFIWASNHILKAWYVMLFCPSTTAIGLFRVVMFQISSEWYIYIYVHTYMYTKPIWILHNGIWGFALVPTSAQDIPRIQCADDHSTNLYIRYICLVKLTRRHTSFGPPKR